MADHFVVLGVGVRGGVQHTHRGRISHLHEGRKMELEGILRRNGVMEYWSDGVMGTRHNTEPRAQDRGNGVVEKTGVQKSEVRSRKTRR